MADRIPLIVDTADGNKLKELPIGDNLNLTGSGVIGAGNIAATSLTIAGIPYNPFSGAYADLTGTPTIPTNTDDIAEGTKQYFSNERVDDRLNNFLVAGTGITLTYDDAANTLTVGATGVGSGGGGSTNLPGLTDVTITAPANNQLLKYDTTTSKWINSFVSYNNLLNLPTYSTVATKHKDFFWLETSNECRQTAPSKVSRSRNHFELRKKMFVLAICERDRMYQR